MRSDKYRLYVLGNNEHYQLGVGYPRPGRPSRPEDPLDGFYEERHLHVSNLTEAEKSLDERIHSIRCGGRHTLLQTEARVIHGAGDNNLRQLGYQGRTIDVDNQQVLVDFNKLYNNVSFFACGETSSAYIVNARAKGNKYPPLLFTEGQGELGRGDRRTTVGGRVHRIISPFIHDPVDGLPSGKVIDFAGGSDHFVAVFNDGSIWGWGKSRNGQLGSTAQTVIRTPMNITPSDLDPDFQPTKAVCGFRFTLIASTPEDGLYRILGDDNKLVQTTKPVDIKGWKTLGATWHAVIILNTDGTLTTWGNTPNWVAAPRGLPLLEDIAVGSNHVVALTQEDPPRVISWGWNDHGNCGAPKSTAKYFNNGFNVITGYQGEVDLLGAGWATTIIQTKEIVQTSFLRMLKNRPVR